MNILLGLIAIILSLILIVGMHEVGHALAAKCFGVKIERISIGFGTPLCSWRSKHGIEWVFARWPLGGYVKLLSSRIQPVAVQDYPYCFDKKPVSYRIIILVSGALMNLLVAWIALIIVSMNGYQETPAILQNVEPQSIAEKAGLHAGDTIISLANQTTPDLNAVGMAFISHLGNTKVQIHIKNKTGIEKQKTLNLILWHKKKNLFEGIGMTFNTEVKSKYIKGVSFGKANQQALSKIKQLTTFFLVMLKQLLTGQVPLSFLLGPFGLFAVMAGSFIQGLSVFFYFIGTLSLAVAVVNLLPIPGLDGGSIVYAFVEKIRGKPLSVAFEVLLHQLVFIAFCVFLVQLIANDLTRFLGMIA